MFDHEVIEAIQADAIERFPQESCGLILRRADGSCVYKPAPNISVDPLTSFHIDERLLLACKDALVAVVHSHPNGPDYPSETDMRQQVLHNVPFGIVSTDGVGCLEPFFWGGDTPIPELIGRGFRHGVTDCYALIRDYYRKELNITLRDYPREWEWWDNGQSLYQDYFGDEGFKLVDEHDVQEHDIFLAQIRSSTPNHAGVYVGGGLILHHLTSKFGSDPSRLSRRDPVGSWSKFISGLWIRHESLL